MRSKRSGRIPPPPENNASPQELAAYFEQYNADELIEAGHLREATEEEKTEVADIARQIAEKRKRSQLNIALSGEEMTMLSNFAGKAHIPVSTLARGWILERLDQENARRSG